MLRRFPQGWPVAADRQPEPESALSAFPSYMNLRNRTAGVSSSLVLLAILLVPAVVPTRVFSQAPLRLEATEAARLAKQGRQEVSVEVATGLELTLWAPDSLVTDPVAIDFDERGTAYVTSSRRAGFYLDIREHANWVPLVHTLKTNADLLKFYRSEMDPKRSDQNTWLPDLNKDGTRDWRDMTVLKERVYRVQDTNGDGVADSSTVAFEGFNDNPTYDVATALLYRDGSVFVGSAPGVWQFKVDPRDGHLVSPVTVSEGYNVHPAYFGHGISGLVMGPDGRIYWEVGDLGFSVVDRNGRRYTYSNQGAVLRANPDGTDFEVFATGIRNLQDFAFDELGNLISVDNDGDYEGETERLVYITEGSDSGWRSNWQYGKYTDPDSNKYNVWMDEGMFRPRFAGQAAFIVPPIAAYHAGPSGIVYNPGTALSDAWRGQFLVSSFTGSPATTKVYALQLKAEGATFILDHETVVLSGILTPGMRFGPDGALYLTDWISGWDSKGKGRIWKLDVTGAALNPARTEVSAILVSDFTTLTTAALASRLGHADARVRLKAQFELVRRADVTTLGSVVRGPGNQVSRLHALWGLGQLARQNPRQLPLLRPWLGDTDAEIRAQAAKVIGDARDASAGAALVPLLADNAARVRFFAAQALGRIAYRPAIEPLVALLADNADRDLQLRHAGSLALARIGDAKAVATLSTHPSKSVRTAAVIALRRMRDAGVARFLTDADENVATEAARAVNDDGGIAGGRAALALALADRRFAGEPWLRRAISANLQLGTTEAVDRVAAFAADRGRPEAMRHEAIDVLAVWPTPSAFDRVDGIYLNKPATRSATTARAAALRLVQSMGTSDTPVPLKVALADAVGRLNVQSAQASLLSWLRSDPSAEVRLAAVRALAVLRPPNLAEVVALALADADGAVRRFSLGLVSALSLPNAEKVRRVVGAYGSGSVEDRQSALGVLGRLRGEEAQGALAGLLADLGAGRLEAAVQIDLVDAVNASESAPLQARLQQYLKSKSADTVVGAFRTALATGGTAALGRTTFTSNPVVGCTKCHKVGEIGSDVGPNLSRIAATLPREDILQAILEPSARIAPGFGAVTVTLRNGEQVVGLLRAETDADLVIAAGEPRVDRRIAKQDITQRTNQPSAMPPFATILTPREIRDVVAYLSTLR